MGYYDYNLEELESLTPFENFLSGVRDRATLKRYWGQPEMFLDPKYGWSASPQKRRLTSDDELAVLVNNFADLIKGDPARGREKIKKYAMYVRKRIGGGGLNPNTSRNGLKPIMTPIHRRNNACSRHKNNHSGVFSSFLAGSKIKYRIPHK